jgi:hypothetical protein
MLIFWQAMFGPTSALQWSLRRRRLDLQELADWKVGNDTVGAVGSASSPGPCIAAQLWSAVLTDMVPYHLTLWGVH